VRSRDEKTGWFIYHWKLQPDQLDAFVRSRKKKALEKMRSRLEYEKGHSFFMCKGCLTVRVTFEEAMESAFRCSSCNGSLISEDNSRTVQVLEDLSRKLESELQERPAAFAP
jgi:transcription initiation factor TFIIE subunit alpha